MGQVRTTTAFPGHSSAIWVKTWNFARHAIEMCMAMCIGIMVLDVAYVWAAGKFGVENPFVRWPELSVFVVMVNMTAPMIAWMRFRGMEWRPILEMSAAMVVEAIIILIAFWTGAIQNLPAGSTSTLWAWQHVLMMPAMLVPMFLRLDMYTGMHHHASPAPA